METYPNISDNDPVYWLVWDDPEIEEFSFDDVLGACPNHLAVCSTSQEGQQATAAQQQLPTIDLQDHVDSAGGLNLFPGLGLYMSTTENDAAFNPVFTPSYGSTTPGTYQSTTSDVFLLSPRRLSVSLPSPRPLAPRPIAPAPPVEQSPEMIYSPADLAFSQLQAIPATVTGPNLPIEPPEPTITNRRPRRRRGSPFISARERRKQDKPEECPICSKGHPYKADLKKHIAARHKGDAHKLGVSTARFLCIVAGCTQTFSRRDHLLRHQKRKHNGSS